MTTCAAHGDQGIETIFVERAGRGETTVPGTRIALNSFPIFHESQYNEKCTSQPKDQIARWWIQKKLSEIEDRIRSRRQTQRTRDTAQITLDWLQHKFITDNFRRTISVMCTHDT